MTGREALGNLGFALFASASMIAVDALLLCVLWNWFLVDAFHLMPLRPAVAIGMMCIYGVLSYDPTTSRSSMTPYERWSLCMKLSATVFVVAWLAHFFV